MFEIIIIMQWMHEWVLLNFYYVEYSDEEYERKPKFPLKSWKYVEVHSNWNNDRISQFRKMEFLRHYFKNWLQLSFWDRYSFAIILCFFE